MGFACPSLWSVSCLLAASHEHPRRGRVQREAGHVVQADAPTPIVLDLLPCCRLEGVRVHGQVFLGESVRLLALDLVLVKHGKLLLLLYRDATGEEVLVVN